MYTCKFFAIYIVRKAAVFYSPTIVYNISKSITIFKRNICCTEPCSRFAIICRIGIYEWIKSINFLIFRLLCKGIESVCSKISLITQGTFSNNAKTVTCRFHCAILNREFDTLKHTKRVCIGGINRLGLINPVKDECQSISLFIKLNSCEREILVHNLKCAIINNHVIIEINGRCDFSQHADTLSKLKQEVPCVYIFHICTRKHVCKICKL